MLIISGLLSRTNLKELLQNFLLVFLSFFLVSLPFWIVTVNDYNFIAGRSSAFSPLSGKLNDVPLTLSIQTQLKKSLVPYVKDGIFVYLLSTLILLVSASLLLYSNHEYVS